MREFDYNLDYRKLNLRRRPDLYRIGRGEQGVLLVEPYKSELLPLWKFRTPALARASSSALYDRYLQYRTAKDFVGMDMARKFIQMGITRARRYANHADGRKYDKQKRVLPRKHDAGKAKAAAIFREVWLRVRADPIYVAARKRHRQQYEAVPTRRPGHR